MSSEYKIVHVPTATYVETPGLRFKSKLSALNYLKGYPYYGHSINVHSTRLFIFPHPGTKRVMDDIHLFEIVEADSV